MVKSGHYDIIHIERVIILLSLLSNLVARKDATMYLPWQIEAFLAILSAFASGTAIISAWQAEWLPGWLRVPVRPALGLLLALLIKNSLLFLVFGPGILVLIEAIWLWALGARFIYSFIFIKDQHPFDFFGRGAMAVAFFVAFWKMLQLYIYNI